MSYVDLTGKRFGRLTVEERTGTDKHGNVLWSCSCDCGGRTVANSYALNSGHTQSCGCIRRERIVASVTTHNDSHERLYHIWQCMKNRCTNPAYKYYYAYGGRGISFCDEWSDYKTFREWATSNGYSESLTLDRIDPNGNYCPSNCRWASRADQTKNRRNNVIVSYHGDNGIFKDMCRKLNVNDRTVRARMRRGYSFEDAIDCFAHTSEFKDYNLLCSKAS